MRLTGALKMVVFSHDCVIFFSEIVFLQFPVLMVKICTEYAKSRLMRNDHTYNL